MGAFIPPTVRIVDHVIVMATPEQAADIVGMLETAGLRMANSVVEPALGIRSVMMPISGGGFIEVASELSPGSFPHGNPFENTPRISNVSYTTADGAADMESWRGKPGTENAMAQAGSWRREDGTMGYFISLWPTPPSGEVFFALQDRRIFPLPFLDEAETSPQIRSVRVYGDEALTWKQRHGDLFGLVPTGDGFTAGDTQVEFDQIDGEITQIEVTLAVPNPDVEIPMLRGGISFVPSQEK